MRIAIGQGSCGIAAGAGAVYSRLKELLGNDVYTTGCIGMCFVEPIVDIYDGKDLKKRLVKVKKEDADKIANAVKSGDLDSLSDLEISADDAAFLEGQTRIALRNCGIIDPTDINEYIAAGGYEALKKAVCELTPEQVIEIIKVSGLAGRGGAGFPTWFKWNAARQSVSDKKYLICNADEGDPGAFMDRAVIESDPHNLSRVCSSAPMPSEPTNVWFMSAPNILLP